MLVVMEQRIIIHIVDADPRNRAVCARTIFDLGHRAEVYEGAEELLARLPSQDIVIANDDPENGVIGLMDEISRRGTWLPVIAMAQNPQMNRVVGAMRAGAFDYLAQPLDADELSLSLIHI